MMKKCVAEEGRLGRMEVMWWAERHTLHAKRARISETRRGHACRELVVEGEIGKERWGQMLDLAVDEKERKRQPHEEREAAT